LFFGALSALIRYFLTANRALDNSGQQFRWRTQIAVIQEALPAGVIHQVATGDAMEALEPGLESGMPAIDVIEVNRSAGLDAGT